MDCFNINYHFQIGWDNQFHHFSAITLQWRLFHAVLFLASCPFGFIIKTLVTSLLIFLISLQSILSCLYLSLFYLALGAVIHYNLFICNNSYAHQSYILFGSMIILLVPDGIVHMVTNRPPFVTQGSLTLDISISPYIIIPFLFFFFLFCSTGKPVYKDNSKSPTPSWSVG